MLRTGGAPSPIGKGPSGIPPLSTSAATTGKVFEAQSITQGRSKLWIRDIVVACLLLVLYFVLAARVSPPPDSPLSKAAKDTVAVTPHRKPAAVKAAATRETQQAVARSAAEGNHSGSVHHVRARRIAAVLGSFVGDAAAMGLHWIYDVNEISRLVKEGKPEFFEPPSSPFYKYESGEQSPYGYEELVLLRSVANAGAVDGPALQQDLYDGFKKYSGRLNRASKDVISNVDAGCKYPQCGSRSIDAHGLVKVAVVAALYAGTPQLAEKTREAVLAHQDSPLVLSTAIDCARLLEHVILHGSVADAMEWGLQEGHLSNGGRELLEHAQQSRHTSHTAAVRRFGQSCELPGSFESDLHGALTSATLAEAVRKTILAGGDSCSRAVFLGAMFGAQDGLAAAPPEWTKKVTRYSEIQSLIETAVTKFHGQTP